MVDDINPEPGDEIPYTPLDELDFSLITSGMKWLPFFEDDLFLGMQAMNVGIVDSIITQQEYSLLREWIEIERTPGGSAMAVSALSQMWIYGLYEVLRLWRDRRYQFIKLFENGGVDLKISSMPEDEPVNPTIETRKKQLLRFKQDTCYRDRIEKTWANIEPVYRMAELYRINLAKHAAPGKDAVIPRSPGYGRINRWCGSLDNELVDKDGHYVTMNRRDIAEGLRAAIDTANK